MRSLKCGVVSIAAVLVASCSGIPHFGGVDSIVRDLNAEARAAGFTEEQIHYERTEFWELRSSGSDVELETQQASVHHEPQQEWVLVDVTLGDTTPGEATQAIELVGKHHDVLQEQGVGFLSRVDVSVQGTTLKGTISGVPDGVAAVMSMTGGVVASLGLPSVAGESPFSLQLRSCGEGIMIRCLDQLDSRLRMVLPKIGEEGLRVSFEGTGRGAQFPQLEVGHGEHYLEEARRTAHYVDHNVEGLVISELRHTPSSFVVTLSHLAAGDLSYSRDTYDDVEALADDLCQRLRGQWIDEPLQEEPLLQVPSDLGFGTSLLSGCSDSIKR